MLNRNVGECKPLPPTLQDWLLSPYRFRRPTQLGCGALVHRNTGPGRQCSRSLEYIARHVIQRILYPDVLNYKDAVTCSSQ